MKSNTLYWKSAIELISKGQKMEDVIIDFQNEKVFWKDAMLLGKNGIDVPDDLIEYDDENIDYSDIPAITDADIASGKIKWRRVSEIPNS